MEPVANQVGIALLLPLIIEWAKDSRHPALAWLDHGQVLAARLLSLAVAAATAAGLAVTYDGSLFSAGTLTIGNLSVWTALQFLWEMAKQFGMQEFAYRAAVRPAVSGPPDGYR